jgi:preprotein translocase subunit Sss1
MQVKKISELTPHWIITSMMMIILITYNIICHTIGVEIQIGLDEEQRVLIRTIFYIAAIILFPVVNLIRYILLRLNQTMPGDNPAKNRYLITVIVTLLSIEVVGVFGFVMFVLGDDYNTLYIFSALAILGIFLHRPRQEEYKQIIEALKEQ